jgi:hypothetical protein
MGYWGSDLFPNAISDSVGNTYDYGFGAGSSLSTPLGSSKGTLGQYTPIAIYQLATYFKSRIFYALPYLLPYQWNTGYFWRWNAASADNAIHDG